LLLYDCSTQDEDVALAIAIANSLKDMARGQSELAELEQVREGREGSDHVICGVILQSMQYTMLWLPSMCYQAFHLPLLTLPPARQALALSMALEAEQRRLAAEQAAAELKGQKEAAALASASGAGPSTGEGASTSSSSSASKTNDLLHRPFPEPHSLDLGSLPALGGAWPGECRRAWWQPACSTPKNEFHSVVQDPFLMCELSFTDAVL
jgi:hypothetical protein